MNFFVECSSIRLLVYKFFCKFGADAFDLLASLIFFSYRKKLLSILRLFAEWRGHCYTRNLYLETVECAGLYHLKCALRMIALFETLVVKNVSTWLTKYFNDFRYTFKVFRNFYEELVIDVVSLKNFLDQNAC